MDSYTIHLIVKQAINHFIYLYDTDEMDGDRTGKWIGDYSTRELAALKGFKVSPDYNKGYLKFNITITLNEI